MKRYTFKIGGPAGLGIMTTGLIFSKTCTRSGLHIFDYIEYPSLIRGGHNVMETRFSQGEVFSQEFGVDLLVALNRETVDLHKNELKNNAGIIFDPYQFEIKKNEFLRQNVSLFPIPFRKIITETGIKPVMENNISLGASIALFDLNLKSLFAVIEDIFKKKGQEVILENQKAAKAGFDYIKRKSYKLRSLQAYLEPIDAKNDKLVMTGNETIALGAIAAGCKFYAAYPMTPSSSILHYLASKSGETGMIVRHAEDEIGVINEAIGASFAGVRSMIGTSGGGFALMNEAVSLAGISETPIVIVVSQRPGPATGMHTWTEQGDLQFVIRSGHGEFPKIVLAPGDVEEAFSLTMKAFNLADIYQTPVFIVLDKYLSESHKSIKISNIRYQISDIKINRGKIERLKQKDLKKSEAYMRYRITGDGISPRILPGTKGYYYQANSYEHLQDGYTTESASERIKQVNKRNKKAITYLKNDIFGPKLYGEKEVEITFIGWGSVKGPVLESIKQCNNRTIKSFNFLHFTHLWPFPTDQALPHLKDAKKLILIENNSQGQFGQLLCQETGIKVKHRLLKYNGRPFYPEEILDYVKKID